MRVDALHRVRRGGAAVAVDPTGTGDVTKTHQKWTIPQVSEGFSSPVVSGEYLYRLHNPEKVTCVRLARSRMYGAASSLMMIACALETVLLSR